jgi:hypothetical protein
LIAELSPLDAARLRSAIDEIFAGRWTHPAPERLPEPPEGWRVRFGQLAEAVAELVVRRRADRGPQLLGAD